MFEYCCETKLSALSCLYYFRYFFLSHLLHTPFKTLNIYSNSDGVGTSLVRGASFGEKRFIRSFETLQMGNAPLRTAPPGLFALLGLYYDP